MKKTFSFITLLSVITLAIFSLFSFSTPTSAQNVGSLQSVVTPGFSFKKDLRVGDTDPDVKELQRVLNADIDTVVTTDGEGSRGRESTYFGEKTKLAVIKLQNKYKDIVLTLNSITTADGVVNKATRTRLNLLIGVINTYDSVGVPQSRASTVTTTVTKPVIVSTPTQPQMSVCQFVELLININVVASTKANAARSALGCGTIASPTVDLKVNGDSTRTTISSARNVTISWTTSGVTSCVGKVDPSNSDRDTVISVSRVSSASASYYADAPARVTLSCSGPNGNAVDTVDIRMSSAGLIASCSPSATAIVAGNSLTWTASSTGGSSGYNYSWSGTDGLSGSGSSISKVYSNVGQKNAQLTVTSGSKTATTTCISMVNASTTLVASTSTPPEPVHLDFQVQPVNNVDKFFIKWNAETATSCKATSLPPVNGWSNTTKTNVGFEVVTITEGTVFTMTCKNRLYSDFASAVAQYTPVESVATTTEAEEEEEAGLTEINTGEKPIGDEYSVRGTILETKRCPGSSEYFYLIVKPCEGDTGIDIANDPTLSPESRTEGFTSRDSSRRSHSLASIIANKVNENSTQISELGKNIIVYFNVSNEEYQSKFHGEDQFVIASTYKNEENSIRASSNCSLPQDFLSNYNNGGWISNMTLQDEPQCTSPSEPQTGPGSAEGVISDCSDYQYCYNSETGVREPCSGDDYCFR